MQAVFPAITSLIVSTHVPPPRLLRPDVFIPLHFLIFNSEFFYPLTCPAIVGPYRQWLFRFLHCADITVGDYLGRTYLPSIPSLLITSPPRVLLMSLSRIIFVPLFLACNVSTRPGMGWISSDLVYLVILLAFGASNG
jgi:equilibrative nucleoside transporter 1/2/3